MTEDWEVHGRAGSITVVCGGMFSGKTEELLRRIRLATYAKRKVALFKPMLDNRYSENEVVSHNRTSLPAINVARAGDIWRPAQDAEVVGIEEGHFFGPELIKVCQDLADAGKRVIVAGLDQDYRGVPFHPMPYLMAIAEHVTKVQAICMVCGNPASRTQRLSSSTDRIQVGGAEAYEARCRLHHTVEPL